MPRIQGFAVGKTYVAIALALMALPQVLHAQCPDGAPPPCRAAAAVSQASRRVAPNPALDAGRWIVVPFDNLAKAADTEWMRGASVNLLYLDLSRWQDIRVVDDERVADLLRETPGAGETSALSLTVGLAVAKRAGAGKLVMGDVLKLGIRTTVTAKVYDVRTGQRVRSVKEDAVSQDSVIALFGKLAQKILNVPPPPGGTVGSIGTTRTDAYREYLAGVAALNRFDLPAARARFGQAIALDSTFALAHYKMAVVYGWESTDAALYRTHAQAAARYASGLPARERSLIAGYVHMTARDYAKAFEVFSALIAADSTDVDAWYNMGECLFHDFTMKVVEGATTKLQFRADWNASIRAFRRVLQLDPQYHLAHQHIIDALRPTRHANGRHCIEGTTRCTTYSGFLIRDGDSLLVTPYALTDSLAMREQEARYDQTQSRRRNLAAALDAATMWVREAPTESRAHYAVAQVLLAQGRVLEASQAAGQTRNGAGSWVEDQRRLSILMDIAFRIGKGREAGQLFDSTRAALSTAPDSGNFYALEGSLMTYGPVLGRFRNHDSLMTARFQARNAPPAVSQYYRRAVRGWLGITPLHDSLSHYENLFFDVVKATPGGVAAATRSISFSLMLSLRAPRTRWPAMDPSANDRYLRPAQALARGDTAGLRAAAQALDSTIHSIVSRAGVDTFHTMVAVDAYLALHDTTNALRMLRFGLDTVAALSPHFPPLSEGLTFAFVLPRLMLLRADLAAARGFKDEARFWYGRFVEAWSTGDAEVQPVVDRARKAYIAAGGTG